jgi:RNA polymerase sigma factor (TIGR02999 family)
MSSHFFHTAFKSLSHPLLVDPLAVGFGLNRPNQHLKMGGEEGQKYPECCPGCDPMDEKPAIPPGTARLPAREVLSDLYDHLRGLAATLASRFPPGQTLQPTAIVHEAYLRLTRNEDPGWDSPRHFFGAAARAMREILIEQARHKASIKGGGQSRRVELVEGVAWVEPPAEDLLALDEAIEQLSTEEPRLAEVVRLRFYAGLSMEEVAAVLGGSLSTLKRDWRYARAWLAGRLGEGELSPAEAER